jgi:Putative auto-transporter adhesin, head GIN domain
MKKISLLLLILVFGAGMAIAQQDDMVVKDKNAQVRTISGSFSAIKVSNSIDLYLTKGNEETVVVSASEDGYRDKIKTELDNGTLKIYYDNPNYGWKSGNYTNKKLRAYVSFKTLNKLTASGACDVYVKGVIKTNDLSLNLSGSSDFKGNIAVENLVINQNGSSDAKIGGTAVNVSIELSGASDVNAYDLIAENCKVRASGASDVSITVNKELTANASGASDINYKGNPSVKDIVRSGASSINRRQ